MRRWVRGSATGTALVIAGILVGASAVAAPDAVELPSVDITIPDDPTQTEPGDDDGWDQPDPTTPTEEPTTPTEEPTIPTEEPTEPTEEPTTPTEEPTTPTEEPTTPTEEPTIPTEEPTFPTEEPTTSPGGTDPDLGASGVVSRAPAFAPIPPITAASRADVSENDLWADVHVLDDVDMRLYPVISSWGDWYSEPECPNGYPCTYRILYLVSDSDGNGAEAARDVIITGRDLPVEGVDIAPLLAMGLLGGHETEDLPWTGVSTGGLVGIGGLLIAGGLVLIISSRRVATSIG